MAGVLVSLTWLPAAALSLAPARVGADAPPAQAPLSVRERWWQAPEPQTPPLVELGALRADGLRWLGRRARVVVQLDARVPTWDAWVSHFHPAAWTRVSVWGDEQFLWQRDEWSRPWSQIYARSDGAAAALLASASRFRRFELEIDVREHLLGEARLEVLHATPLSESVGEGAILHASRALDLLDRGQIDLARSEFERAQAGRLPEHARAELARLQAFCGDG
jgi:hypothetical protein